MDVKGLVEILNSIAHHQGGDPEMAHAEADQALLDYIGEREVTEAYERIDKWYA